MRLPWLLLICLLLFCCGCNTLYQLSVFRQMFGKDDDEVDTYPFIGVWADVEHMPLPRAAACAAIGSKIYVCGGEDASGALDTVEEYDTDADAWTPLCSLPAPATGHACVALDDKIYMVGGTGGSHVYDPAGDSWGPITGPQPVSHACAAALDGKIYLFGGKLDSGITCASAQEYDPLLDTWTDCAFMPGSRAGAFCETAGANIYVIGGVNNPDGGGPDAFTDSVFEYIPALDYWSQKESMSEARAFGCSGVVNGRIVVAGGFDGTYPGISTVAIYNPVWNYWQALRSEPSSRSFTCGAAIGTRVYVIGGKVGEASYTALTREFISP